MTDYVLVHGGAHGAWCWERLMPYLRNDSRVGEVLALDLVGHGDRLKEKPFAEITLQDYIQDISQFIKENGLRDVILVGHSLSGISTPQAAALVRDRVKRLVLISACVPPEGNSANDAMIEIAPHLISFDGSAEQYYQNAFCNDMDEETAQWLLGKLGPEPSLPFSAPVCREGFSSTIPVTYIVLLRDQALPVDAQRVFLKNINCTDIIELDSGHAAMISHPKELAEILLRFV